MKIGDHVYYTHNMEYCGVVTRVGHEFFECKTPNGWFLYTGPDIPTRYITEDPFVAWVKEVRGE